MMVYRRKSELWYQYYGYRFHKVWRRCVGLRVADPVAQISLRRDSFTRWKNRCVGLRKIS